MIKDRFEVWVSKSGNVSVYRGSAFFRTEELTEEEKEFIIDRIANELGVNTKGDRETFAEHYGCISETDNNLKEVVATRDLPLEDEIKRYTEERYHETFGNGQRAFDEFDWEDIASVIEDTARYFYNLQPHWKPSDEQMEALKYFVNHHQGLANQLTIKWDDFEELKSLYDNLKKLM